MKTTLLQYFLWWVGNGLMATILVRALTQNLFRHYPLFFSYLGYGLLKSLALFVVYVHSPKLYATLFWPCEFVDVALGFFIIWEIYRLVLGKRPGIAGATRSLLLVTFLVLVLYSILGSMRVQPWPQSAVGVLERNTRVVQVVLLTTVIAFLAYYLVPIGRNTKGLIVGYSVFIAATIVNFASRHYFGGTFHVWLNHLQPLAYDLTLVIWCGALWAYHPDPMPEGELLIEKDYRRLVSVTNGVISNLRAYVLGLDKP